MQTKIIDPRKIYTVVFSSVAGSRIDDLYFYIADKAGDQTADAFVGGIQQLCMSLADFPHRGTRRDNVAIPGLRTIGYKRRALIAFTVDDDAASVTILGVFYGGQDFERHLEIDTSDE